MFFNKVHVYSHSVHVYMYIWSLNGYKMLLEKDSTAKTSWENKGKNSRVYFTARQLIGSDTLTIHRGHTEYAQHVERSYVLCGCYSFRIRSWSLACRY